MVQAKGGWEAKVSRWDTSQLLAMSYERGALHASAQCILHCKCKASDIILDNPLEALSLLCLHKGDYIQE